MSVTTFCLRLLYCIVHVLDPLQAAAAGGARPGHQRHAQEMYQAQGRRVAVEDADAGDLAEQRPAGESGRLAHGRVSDVEDGRAAARRRFHS